MSCLIGYLDAYKLNETGKLLSFKDILLSVTYILAIPQTLSYSVDFQLQLANEWGKSCKVT